MIVRILRFGISKGSEMRRLRGNGTVRGMADSAGYWMEGRFPHWLNETER